MKRATFLLLLALLAAMTVAPLQARVLTVTKTADTLDSACDQDCSLREAVAAANLSDDVVNVIVLPAGTYTLTRQGAGEEHGATGDLDVFSPLLLVGAGADATVIDGNGLDRIFDLRESAEISGVTLRNGRVNGDGGGILLRQVGVPSLLVARSIVSGNRAASGGDGGNGGGIASESRGEGALRIASSAILDNHAEGDGGGIASREAALTNVTVSGNRADGSGGGLYLPDESTLSAVTVAFNRAGLSGGGLDGGPATFFRASILSGNTAPQDPDCSGASSSGYNRLGAAGDGTCALDPITDESLHGVLVAPLSFDGPIPGHLLLPNSPAENTVPALACEPADQSGQPRRSPCDAGALENVEPKLCVPGGSGLCLQEGRFRVTAAWRTKAGEIGLARAVPLTADTGIYWFFGPDNLELTVKVLDGCAVNDRWWVFSTGLTDVGVTLTVEDLAVGRVKTYTHPAGTTYAPKLDTSAFATCVGETEENTAAPNLEGSAILVVSRTDDPVPGACDHDCSLREAVIAANARPGLEVIVLGPHYYNLQRPGRAEDASLVGDLDIHDDLVILGAGADHTEIRGGGHDRVLDQTSLNAVLEVHGTGILGGFTEAVPGDLGDGGGVRAYGTLVLVGAHFNGNWSAAGGGGVSASFLEVRSSTFAANNARNGGGLLAYGSMDLENVTVSENIASEAGGGVYSYAQYTRIRNSTIAVNSARVGGGVYQNTDYSCPGSCEEVFELDHSILALNGAQEGRNCVGLNSTVETDGYNLIGISDGVCSLDETDRAGTWEDPVGPSLSFLMPRGGPTPTHGLNPDSPARDVGGECPLLDQRGRPRNGPCDAGAFELSAVCEEGSGGLCLGGRFLVTTHWYTSEFNGFGVPHPLTRDTGAFYFFHPANLELTVKALDGCSVNQHHWVFLSGLTDVKVDITVEDMLTRTIKTYSHDGKGPFVTQLDTNAFACP